MARVEMELRNLPRFRIMEYLLEAGGTAVAELGVEGDGWSAHLEEMEPATIGSFTIRRDCLVIEGQPDEVADIHAHMRNRTMRGGG